MSQKRRVVQIVKILIGVELVWIVAANLFLSTGLAPWAINRKPEKWSVTWESARSYYPFRVHATNVVYEQHTATIDVAISANQASTRVRVLPLLLKRFVLDELDIGKLNVVLIRKPKAEGSVATTTASTKTKPGFTIVLSDISVEQVERFAFNELEIVGGTAPVKGTFSTQIRNKTEIRGASLQWQGAKIRFGDKELANSLKVGFEGGFSPFHPKKETGLKMLAHLSAVVDVEGHVKSLLPLQLFFADVGWIERLDGEGDVAAHMVFDDGRMQAPSDIDVMASSLQLDFLGFRAEGTGIVKAIVEEVEGSRAADIHVAFDEYEFARQGDETPFASGTGLRLEAQANALGVLEELDGLHVVLDLPTAQVSDISFLGKMLPDGLGVTVAGGSATLEAHIEVEGDEEEAKGTFELHAEDLEGSFRDMEFDMDVEIATQLSGTDFDDFKVGLQGTEIRLYNGVFDNDHSDQKKGWWMTIAIPEGEANLKQPLGLEAEIDLSMRDTRAVVALFTEVKSWLKYLEGMLTVEDVVGHAQIAMRDKELSVRELSLTGDNLEAMAELELEKENNAGIFWFKFGFLSLGLERLGNETHWKMIHGKEWYEEQLAESWISKRGEAIDPVVESDPSD